MATNLSANSATLTIRLDAAALAAFDSFAVGRGGRSAVLRQMIEQTLPERDGGPFIDRPEGVAGNRVSLRFTDVEIAVIAHRASQRSTDRAGWIKALVRRHLALKSRVDDGLLAELAPIRMQLLRIGRFTGSLTCEWKSPNRLQGWVKRCAAMQATGRSRTDGS
jgi:hypothetical protein